MRHLLLLISSTKKPGTSLSTVVVCRGLTLGLTPPNYFLY